MSAEVDRHRLTMPLKTAGRINQPDICGGFKNDRPQAASRHYSFTCDEKPFAQKRRYSERYTSSAAHSFRRKFARFANRGNMGRIVLPTKFLLGGNIRDPLNLNSLCDEEINRSLNEITPVSSPLPIPWHRLENKVPIIHPANIHDPLNLEDSNENAGVLTVPLQKKRKRRHSHRKPSKVLEKSESGEDVGGMGKLMMPLSLKIDPIEADVSGQKRKGAGDFKKIVDKIVSPVIPQVSPKRRQRRTLSECRHEAGEAGGPKASQTGDAEKSGKSERTGAGRLRGKRNSINQTGFKGKNAKFTYGNYSTYHGYRTPAVEDSRLKMFSRDVFEGKDVLDIGCNVGQFTLGVAQKFSPRKIVGIDVDGKLIEAAKKNVRHYISEDAEAGFPMSLKIMRGPLAAHPLLQLKSGPEEKKFPHNVVFQKANYYLESNEDVQSQQPEYDVIIALGITKWIHLNYGDAGLKRCFLRMFRQLRPGGSLILEAQKWGSYRKKKKLTDHTYQIYKSIQFRPDQFREFLTSKEVGFASSRFLGVSSNKSKGSCATIHIFTKDVAVHQLDRRNECTVIEQEMEALDVCEVQEPPHAWVDSAESRSSLGWLEMGSSNLTPCSTCDNSPCYTHTSYSSTPRTERTCSSVEGVASRDLSSFANRFTDQIGNSPVQIEKQSDSVAKSLHPAAEDLPDRNGH